MHHFKETSHLSLILEESEKEPVIIFKYSSECNSSTRLSATLEKNRENKKILFPIYKVTVQKQPVLSQKIAEWFNIKHESPQIIIIHRGKVTYTDHHNAIQIEKFRYN